MKQFFYAILLLLISLPAEAGEWGIHDFDLAKDQKRVTSVDLVIFDGWTRYNFLGGKVEKDTFVMGDIRAKIKKKIPNITFDFTNFNKLINGYKKNKDKEYEDCFCQPNYVFALVFKAQANQDGFSRKQVEEKVAIAMFDESHDSVLISDHRNGVRNYVMSVGHSEEAIVPKYIKFILSKVNEPYRFMGREPEKR